MVIGLATDVGVGSERSGGGFFRLYLIELGVKDVLDSLILRYQDGIRADTGGKSTSAGCFETFVRVAFAEVEDSHAGSVGLLGVSSGGEDGFHQLSRMGADLLSPAQETVGRPLAAAGSGVRATARFERPHSHFRRRTSWILRTHAPQRTQCGVCVDNLSLGIITPSYLTRQRMPERVKIIQRHLLGVN